LRLVQIFSAFSCNMLILLVRRRFVPETLCYRRRFVTGDVLFRRRYVRRRFVWRRFVEETFGAETFCMCAVITYCVHFILLYVNSYNFRILRKKSKHIQKSTGTYWNSPVYIFKTIKKILQTDSYGPGNIFSL
jgi:hypothetical protein